jgi:molecular chaperone DnaK (HSP70)
MSQAAAADSNPIVGIDLGTTNSLVAICDERGPRVLPLRSGGRLLPSVVRYDGERVACVGREARAGAVQFPLQTVMSAKRLMGRSHAESTEATAGLQFRVVEGPRGLAAIDLGSRRALPQEVAAAILAELKASAEAALGVEVRRAVVTVPAYFDDGQRQATRDAARLAGLDAVRIVNEPTAAALAYGVARRRSSQVVAVYDFGGGTFDISILRVGSAGDEEGEILEVLATAGDTRLGGDEIDYALAESLLAEAAQASGLGAAFPATPAARQAIRDFAEAAKIALSDAENTQIEIELPEVRVARSVTRVELERLAAPFVARTIAACERALRDAGGIAIDQVVLVGGSTRMPLVRRAVRELFGVEPYTALDPDLVVAMGAAVQGAILAGNRRDLLLLDVIPLSLGLETVGGGVAKLIHRNAQIPTRATEMFSTSVDNQTGVEMHVLQGEREMVEDCRSLARFTLRGLPPMPAGIPQVEVEFLVDANGVLRVDAVEKRSGCRASVQVVPSYGLTEAEVDALERESVTHARADMVRHRVADLAVHSQLDIKWIRDALGRARAGLDAAYLQELEAAIARVDGFIELARGDALGVDADAFQRAKEWLDRTSMRLHEHAIAASLSGMRATDSEKRS